jgi:hypothetical protein
MLRNAIRPLVVLTQIRPLVKALALEIGIALSACEQLEGVTRAESSKGQDAPLGRASSG